MRTGGCHTVKADQIWGQEKKEGCWVGVGICGREVAPLMDGIGQRLDGDRCASVN